MSKKKKYTIIMILEVIVLVAMIVLAYGVYQYSKLDTNEIDLDSLEVYCDTGNYTNIALFGLDSRNGELGEGVRSDCMMIASINNETHEVKIISVYRDLLLLQKDGLYEKANAAYSYGGPQEAIAMLNRNFDLDIVKYVSVNFNALADVVDALGGIDIEMTEEEVGYANDYIDHTAKVVGGSNAKLSGSGVMHCNGVQAVSFTRIRYTEGYDFKRTHRQRIVLEKIVEKAKASDFVTLNKVIDKVFPQISTNLTISNMVGLAAHAIDYSIGKMSGFPFEMENTEQVLNHQGAYVIPVGHSDNVCALHAYLFGEEDYQPSETVNQINDDIIYLSGISPDYHGDLLDFSYSTGEAGIVNRNRDYNSGTEESEYPDNSYEGETDYGYENTEVYTESQPYVEDSEYTEQEW